MKMTELAEGIAIGTFKLDRQIAKNKCPFVLKVDSIKSLERENIAYDDEQTEAVWKIQKNNGGVLGENLVQKSNGADGTVGGPCDPPDAEDAPRPDEGRKVIVPGAAGIETGAFPFTAAAHHLIPGNASLENSHLIKYMKKGGTVQSEDGAHTWTIKEHIGYNINGAHNGVWLPATYAIRAKTSPVDNVSWGGLSAKGKKDWCISYIAAVSKAVGGTLHDTHDEYSEAVTEILNAIHSVLLAHQEICPLCKDKTEVAPPYIVKRRLFNLSSYFRTQLKAEITAWKRPWFTSDHWRKEIFDGGKVSAYIEAISHADIVAE
jgi:hypothetical protein